MVFNFKNSFLTNLLGTTLLAVSFMKPADAMDLTEEDAQDAVRTYVEATTLDLSVNDNAEKRKNAYMNLLKILDTPYDEIIYIAIDTHGTAEENQEMEHAYRQLIEGSNLRTQKHQQEIQWLEQDIQELQRSSREDKKISNISR